MVKVMTKEDKKWQAEQDAHTLANAAEISKDKARAKRAVAAAKKLAVDAQKTAKTVSRQAGIKKKRK